MSCKYSKHVLTVWWVATIIQFVKIYIYSTILFFTCRLSDLQLCKIGKWQRRKKWYHFCAQKFKENISLKPPKWWGLFISQQGNFSSPEGGRFKELVRERMSFGELRWYILLMLVTHNLCVTAINYHCRQESPDRVISVVDTIPTKVGSNCLWNCGGKLSISYTVKCFPQTNF